MIFNIEKAIAETQYIFHINKGHLFDKEKKQVVKEPKSKKKKRIYPIYS